MVSGGIARLCYAMCLVIKLMSCGIASASSCDTDPPAARMQLASAAFSGADLIALRDIGNPDSSQLGPPSPIAVDPTGRSIVFILTGSDPLANRHCRWLMRLDLDTGRAPVVLDRGGEFIGITVNRAGVRIASGATMVIVPQWSPDGRHIAYLRRDGGATRMWIVPAAGGISYPATDGSWDVVSFRWQGAAEIVFQTQAADDAGPDGEAARGYLFDHRFVPTTSARPQPAASDRYDLFRLKLLDRRSERIARATEEAAIGEIAVEPPARARLVPTSASPLTALRVAAVGADGSVIPCVAETCEGRFTGVWSDDDGHVLFLRREGSARDRFALYRWQPGSQAPRNVLTTSDALIGCMRARGSLLCLREHATRTRHLVAIDIRSGEIRELYDPNPQTRAWRFGDVQRLYWTNRFGLHAYGDLVLPPGTKRGDDLPLIIVQYTSVGFLRGGTGDEYPIHWLAQQGFAVLSVQNPPLVAVSRPDLATATDINAFLIKGWAERRSLYSSIEEGIDKVLALGVVDPERIGITGLSDGATTVRFGLINGDRFAAAAVSSCCIDPNNIMVYNGPSYAAMARAMGYPPVTEYDPSFWKPVSLAVNAERVDVPLLMQLSDDEYLVALESYTALRERDSPVEMYVFPGEHHVKTQPAHRLAIYRRSVQWFAFWLQGREYPDPLDPDQYRRWRDLRDRNAAKEASAKAP